MAARQMTRHPRIGLLLPLQHGRSRRLEPGRVSLLAVLDEAVRPHTQRRTQLRGKAVEMRWPDGRVRAVHEQQRVHVPPQRPPSVRLPHPKLAVLAPVEDGVRVVTGLPGPVEGPGDVRVGDRPAVVGGHEENGVAEPPGQQPARPGQFTGRAERVREAVGLPRTGGLGAGGGVVRERDAQHEAREQVRPPRVIRDGLAQRARVPAAGAVLGDPARSALPGRPVVELRDQMPRRLGRRHRDRITVREVPEQHRPVDTGGPPEDQLVHPRRIRRPLRRHTLRLQPGVLEERPPRIEEIETPLRHLVVQVGVHSSGLEPSGRKHPASQAQPLVDLLGRILVVQTRIAVARDPDGHRREQPQQPGRGRRHRHLQIDNPVRLTEQLPQPYPCGTAVLPTDRNPRLVA